MIRANRFARIVLRIARATKFQRTSRLEKKGESDDLLEILENLEI